ncbi:Nuclear pore complex protein [Hordeum vulgare]|nr:Nuclear pore complex protein [Hordeum vulgare]
MPVPFHGEMFVLARDGFEFHVDKIPSCVTPPLFSPGPVAFALLGYAATGNIQMVEDKLMQQKAKLLLDEAASWSLLWYLYGKANEELPEGLFMVN